MISHLKGNHIVLKNNNKYSDKYMVQKNYRHLFTNFTCIKNFDFFFNKLYKEGFFLIA